MHLDPGLFVIVTFLVAIGAGAFGSLLGLGGGVILIPVLTLVLDVDIKIAVAASAIAVIATSSGAAAAYVAEHLSNVRVGMFLEMATTAGAITGALLAGVIETRWLFVTFGVVLGYSSLAMLRKRAAAIAIPADPVADRLLLHGRFYDQAAGTDVDYRVGRSRLGLGLMYVAGTVSGLLGIGSGALKVPAMDLAMGLPLKVSTATSNFMMGVTAAASSVIYLLSGKVEPLVAGPVAAGVLIGATAGSRLLPRISSSSLRLLFVVVLVTVSSQMLVKGLTS